MKKTIQRILLALCCILALVGTVLVGGCAGRDGQSTYELAVEKGYTGTEEEWLASLVGVAGADGKDGKDGKSAYELAVENGFEGTLSQWLDSLVGTNGTNGTNGTDGKSAYELAVENGYAGTLTEWLASLVGASGTNGTNGIDGTDGKSAYDLAVENGYSGTVQEWLASLVGAAGANGTNGTNGKTAYELAVENGYTGTEEEWLSSLVGAKGDKGDKGDDGLSAYEIYKKYHPEYTGTEEEWINSLKGSDGAQGEQGIGIKNAYINEEYHLILVLTNNTEIDAGYVGVTVTPEPTTYTVTFVDYDGTVLKTETVKSGESATPPTNPVRSGYAFNSWSGIYINVTANQTVTATYIQLASTRNLLEITYVDNLDGTLTLTIALKGDVVNVAGIEGYISFDTSKLAFSSRSKLSSLSGSVNYDSNDSKVYFSLADAQNLTEAEQLFTITLTYTDAVNTQITLTITDIYDQDYNTETYTIVGGNVVVG